MIDDDFEEHTVFTWTERYWDLKWPALEPRARRELARYLNRARRHLVDRAPTIDHYRAVETYLGEVSLQLNPRPSDVTAATTGEIWLSMHSLPMADVRRRDLEELVDAYARNQRDPAKRVRAATIRRMVADLRPCWERAVFEDVIDVNPWDKVDLSRWTRAGSKRRRTRLRQPDAELVLSPEEVLDLADACATHGTWGDCVRAFVLVLGFCGLRPSEACGVVLGDLELPDAGRAGWLTVRRNHRPMNDRYLDEDDDPDWGPLKGRDLDESRRVPVPTTIVPALRRHVDAHVVDAHPHSLLFQRHGRTFDLSNFDRDVWRPARAALFPPLDGVPLDSPLQPKRTRLRRHDLRHAACSMWLRAGVDITVCQRWSGHRQLSVFLDVYQGLVPGREEEGVRRVEALLAA